MKRLGFADQEMVDVRTHADDGVDRRVKGFRVHAYDLPAGAVAGYYPELNPLMPLWHHDKEAHTPAAKSIPVEILKSAA